MEKVVTLSNHLQIVFLIDENSTYFDNEIILNEASNAIRLCVLRILTYFNEEQAKNVGNLRWGFKFYNSKSLTQRYERHNFKDVCVSSFEDFENDVCCRFEESFRKTEKDPKRNTSSTILKPDPDYCFQEAPSFSKPTSAKCLTCALTDLVHDFQWEGIDLNSPVRKTRQSKLASQKQKTRNMVFLLSSCPASHEALDEFCGSQIRGFESLRNTLMSSALLREFSSVYRISLYWIDTGASWQNPPQLKDDNCRSIVGSFLKMLNGTLIPLSSLVNLDMTTTISDSRTLTTEGKQSQTHSALLVPLASVMNSYIQPGRGDCVLGPVVKGLPDENNRNAWVGWLCSTGNGNKVHCSVKLSSMLASTCNTRQDAHTLTEQNREQPAKASFILKYSSNSPRTAFHVIDVMAEEDNQKEQVTQSSPNLFWIKGVVKRDRVCPTWLHARKVYMCVGMATDGVTELDSSDVSGVLSGWYQKLMLTLARQNLLLVVEIRDPVCGLPVISVLQPLTSVCSVISVMNSNRLVILEKLLLWSGEQYYGQRDDSLECETMCKMVGQEKTTGEKARKKLSHCEVNCLIQRHSSSAEGERSQSKPWIPQDLDLWCLGLACTQPVPLCLQQLPVLQTSQQGDVCNSSDEESSLMKKLKELYSKRKTTPKQPAAKQTTKPMSFKSQETVLKSAQNKMLDVKPRNSESGNDHVSGNEVADTCSASSAVDTETQPVNPRGHQGHEQDNKEYLLASLKLNGEQDCIAFLKELYNKEITGSGDLPDYLDKTMALVNWQNKQSSNTDNKKSIVQSLLSEHLLLDNYTIKKQYEGQAGIHVKERKIREYQLQALLRMELASLMTEPRSDTAFVDEVVLMLRAISFNEDPGFLRDFMHEVILQRYAKLIPQFLCEVYEGLMQNPPRELLSPSQLSDEESPLKRCEPSSIARPESDQPRSSGGRPITRHRSIADIGGKRREIVIPARAKPKTSKVKNDESVRAASAHEIRSEKVKVQKTPVTKVRRNLFTGEEKEEGCSTKGSPKKKLKVPNIFAKDKRKPQARHKFSRRHSVAGCSSEVVQETPARKQLPHALWQRQHRARKESRGNENSLKSLHINPVTTQTASNTLWKQADRLPRRSPRRHPGSSFQRSKSFYGRAAASCPLTRTRSFTAATSSESPAKKRKLDYDEEQENSVTDANTDGTTPSKSKGTKVKESPIRFSPVAKRKKFSLHTLLTTTLNSESSSPRKRTSKPSTPKMDRVPDVRSSPRLFKRRSFSCIGFVNSAPLDGTKSRSRASLDNITHDYITNNAIMTSSSSASPGLEKQTACESAVCEVDSPKLPSISSIRNTTPRRTPKRSIVLSPSKGSPRLNNGNNFKGVGDISSNAPTVQSPNATPKRTVSHSPTTSSPKLQTKLSAVKIEVTTQSEASTLPPVQSDVSETDTRRRSILWTPTRSSAQVRKLEDSDEDCEITFKTGPNQDTTQKTQLQVRLSAVKAHVESWTELPSSAMQISTQQGTPTNASKDSRTSASCSKIDKTSPFQRRSLRLFLNDAQCDSSVLEDKVQPDEGITNPCSGPVLSRNEVQSDIKSCAHSLKPSGYDSHEVIDDDDVATSIEGFSSFENDAASNKVCEAFVTDALVSCDSSNSTSHCLVRNGSGADLVLLLTPVKNIRITPRKKQESGERHANVSIGSAIEDLQVETRVKVPPVTTHTAESSAALDTRQRELSFSPSENRKTRSEKKHIQLLRKRSKEFPSSDFDKCNVGINSEQEDLRFESEENLVEERQRKVTTELISDNKDKENVDEFTHKTFTVSAAMSGDSDFAKICADSRPREDGIQPSKSKAIGAVLTRKSPRKSSVALSNPSATQRLLVAKPTVSTPPRKKQKKSHSVSGSPRNGKRSSPINQILKQRKRSRPESSKSWKTKEHIQLVFGHNPLRRSPKKARKSLSTKKKAKKARELTIPEPELVDECSKSSEDMMDDWLTDIEFNHVPTMLPPRPVSIIRQPLPMDECSVMEPVAAHTRSVPSRISPPTKDATTKFKSVVYGNDVLKKVAEAPKVSRTSLDSSFDEEDDDVFQSPSLLLRSRKKRIKTTTPISASSLKILQESPILFGSSNARIRMSPGSISKSWSEFSPSDKDKRRREQLKRRKRSEAFSELSSDGEHESSMNESEESDEYRNSVKPDCWDRFSRLRKKIKLPSN